MAALPAAVALLARLRLGQRLAPRTLLAVALAAAGIALLALARDAGVAGERVAGGRLVAGHLLLVGAVGCEAVYVVLGQRLAAGIAPRRISALINLWGCALVAPLGAWQALGFDFAAVAPPHWALLAFYALAASVVSVWLWMRGLREVPAAQAGVFTVLLPLASAVVGVAVLGEPWSPAHAAALALAIGAGPVALAQGAAGSSPSPGTSSSPDGSRYDDGQAGQAVPSEPPADGQAPTPPEGGTGSSADPADQDGASTGAAAPANPDASPGSTGAGSCGPADPSRDSTGAGPCNPGDQPQGSTGAGAPAPDDQPQGSTGASPDDSSAGGGNGRNP
jgi:hypothetical protein